jgi:hypothetical protein
MATLFFPKQMHQIGRLSAPFNDELHGNSSAKTAQRGLFKAYRHGCKLYNDVISHEA